MVDDKGDASGGGGSLFFLAGCRTNLESTVSKLSVDKSLVSDLLWNDD